MKRSGYIAIIGKTNVGKSTILNSLSGKKVTITSKKPQTTRSNIFSMITINDTQMVFIDTPGLHKQNKKRLNKELSKRPKEALENIDLVIAVVAGTKFDKTDKKAFEIIENVNSKKILVINKIDLVKNKKDLFPFTEKLNEEMQFDAIVPVSATKNNGVEILLKEIKNYLPEGDFLFPDEGFNFQSIAFEISEIIREKVIRLLGDELPYESAVIVDQIDDQKDLVKLIGSIIVAKNSQKTIVIGKKGEKIKSISTTARKELENYFGKKVYLELWCKVQKNWTDNSKILDGLGIKNRI